MQVTFIEAKFDSLEECLGYIRKNYPDDQTCRTEAINLDTGEMYEANAPAFLYRGEPVIYDTTKSSIMRLQQEPGLSERAKETIQCLTLMVNMRVLQHLRSLFLDKSDSLAFLQHYGMPTQMIDFTSKLNVAALFATASDARSEQGIIGVLPIPARFENFRVFDHTAHYGKRPEKQYAYGVYSENILDLKSDDARNKVQMKWFSFKQSSSKVMAIGNNDLLDFRDDKFAGLIRSILDSFPKQADDVARWLADHVAPPPLILNVKSYHDKKKLQPKEVDFIPVGKAFDECVEREKNYRRWSLAHPDVLTRADGKWRMSDLLLCGSFENEMEMLRGRLGTFQW